MLDYNGKVSLNVILTTSHTKVNIFVIFSGNLCKSTMFFSLSDTQQLMEYWILIG